VVAGTLVCPRCAGVRPCPRSGDIMNITATPRAPPATPRRQHEHQTLYVVLSSNVAMMLMPKVAQQTWPTSTGWPVVPRWRVSACEAANRTELVPSPVTLRVDLRLRARAGGLQDRRTCAPVRANLDNPGTEWLLLRRLRARIGRDE
jgi:hypothetical protein